MGLVGTIIVFLILWWLVFFAVLPIGVRGQFEDGGVTPGTEEGAPSDPQLRRKAIWATIGAGGLTAALFILSRVFNVYALFYSA